MGRRVGSKNKVALEIKQQVLACYERMGGLARFQLWAEKNESQFYHEYCRLAPRDINLTATVRDATSLSDAELAAIATGSSDSTAEPATGETDPTAVH